MPSLTCMCAGSFLDEISQRLSAAEVPHATAVGTLEDSGAILAAARARGIPDFEEHLWLGSLLETYYLMRHMRQARAAEGAQWPEGAPESIIEVLALLPALHGSHIPRGEKLSRA